MKQTLLLSLTALTLLAGCSGSSDSKVKMPNFESLKSPLQGVTVQGHKCELTTPSESKDIFISFSKDKKSLTLRDFTGHSSVSLIGARIEKFDFLTLAVRSLSPLEAGGLILPLDKASVSEEGKFINSVATVTLDENMSGTIVASTTILDQNSKVTSLPPAELGKISQCAEFEANY